jgi:hypothetical protein
MSFRPKVIYDLFYKENYISLKETIVRLNMLADFIEANNGTLALNKAHTFIDDISDRKENLNECSIVECAAQTEAFNAIGLWMTSKESSLDRDFVSAPYPHFKTFYKLTYAPGATSQEEANAFHNQFFPMAVFFGLHPAVYKFLLSPLHYEYDFCVFKHTVLHWLKSLDIPESHMNTLNFETINKFFRFSPMDVVKRIRHFVSVLEQSPLTGSYDATYNMLDFSGGELESKPSRIAIKIKIFMQKISIFKILANRSEAA